MHSHQILSSDGYRMTAHQGMGRCGQRLVTPPCSFVTLSPGFPLPSEKSSLAALALKEVEWGIL